MTHHPIPPHEPHYPDALPHGPARGRAAALNPANRFDPLRLHVLGDHLDRVATEQSAPTQVRTERLVDQTRSIINHVDSPDLPFSWTLNPYRGCEHGCIYCYARPSHEMLGFSCGLDFETRIMVKEDAPELLKRELARPRWRGEPIIMSGITDPYQPQEASLEVTRRCLEVMAECRQPVSIITKNRLVTRDLDLLRELAEHRAVHVALSVTSLDATLAAKMEPRASRPADRLRAISELSAAGIPVTAMMAPIIPSITDHEIPAVLQAVAEAGATRASWVMLRLPWQVKSLFLDWLQRHFPDRASRIENEIRRMRNGKLYDAAWGNRGRGEGARAEQIAATFKVFAGRHRLDRAMPPLSSESFRRPPLDGQMDLF